MTAPSCGNLVVELSVYEGEGQRKQERGRDRGKEIKRMGEWRKRYGWLVMSVCMSWWGPRSQGSPKPSAFEELQVISSVWQEHRGVFVWEELQGVKLQKSLGTWR